MSEVFGSIWWYLVTIGVLVSFHEFGHFWVARRCGVKVLKFSIGFGKPLWSRTGKDGTVYALGSIPLGGFVSMLDERVEDVPAAERHLAHNNKSTAQKIAIAAAGPAFNFLLAFIAFWLMFAIGKPDYEPVLGRVEGLAAEAGIAVGSRVLAVDGTPYTTWSGMSEAVFEKALYRRDTELRIREPDGDERSVVLALSRLPQELDNQVVFARVGLWQYVPATVGFLAEGESAEAAGLQLGDRILAINGAPVADFGDVPRLLQVHAPADPVVLLSVERAGRTLEMPVTAKVFEEAGKAPAYRIGIGPAPVAFGPMQRYNPAAAVGVAAAETWKTTAKTVAFLRDMLMGNISLRNLSGPITIGRVANAVAKDGLAWFLGFLAMVSVGIAVLNLLPIPILDGGHILSYLIESIKGGPLSERTEMVGQYLGLGLLACLIGLALFNDVAR